MVVVGMARRMRTSPIERGLVFVTLFAIGCSGAGTVLETIDRDASQQQDGAQSDGEIADVSNIDSSKIDAGADVTERDSDATFEDACDGCIGDALDESPFDGGGPG